MKVFYYILILLTLILFLISINFSLRKFSDFIKKVFNLFQKNNKIYTDKSEIINEYIPQDEIKNLIQEDLPFIKSENKNRENKLKFKLPNIELLKFLQKRERKF
jgi:S-DNA-T family DNA segregation ATPase FtsK/SpoIIIE